MLKKTVNLRTWSTYVQGSFRRLYTGLKSSLDFSHHRVRVTLIAIVIGGIICGSTAYALGAFNRTGNVSKINAGSTHKQKAEVGLAASESGQCFTWAAAKVPVLKVISCTDPHYFEIAAKLDTAHYPTSEFAADSPRPSVERFTQIRNEYCPPLVRSYLGGKLDPLGRFVIGMMYPSVAGWDNGDRTLRCGLQLATVDGLERAFTGRVKDQDQSQQWAVGTCLGINSTTRQATDPVKDCSQPHSLEVTGIVSLDSFTPASVAKAPTSNSGTASNWPSRQRQEAELKKICPTLTNKYLGNPQRLGHTTLNVQWNILSEISWLAGSRHVLCYLGLPYQTGFATIVGGAKSEILINGKPPVRAPAQPPGRSRPTPVPLPPGVNHNPTEGPAG